MILRSVVAGLHGLPTGLGTTAASLGHKTNANYTRTRKGFPTQQGRFPLEKTRFDSGTKTKDLNHAGYEEHPRAASARRRIKVKERRL